MNMQFMAVSGQKKMEIGFRNLMMMEGGEKALSRLMTFKASETKDSNDRYQGLHGPYEELVIQRTGRLPDDYYVEGDDVPWGLRINESRSNILWQVLSGILDHRPEFAAPYLGLALDSSLNVDEYKLELAKIHKDWARYNSTKHLFNDHWHGAMTRKIGQVCAACSVLTAMACENPAMNILFQKLIPMSMEDRKLFLEEQGFAPLLNVMIPDQPIYIECHI